MRIRFCYLVLLLLCSTHLFAKPALVQAAATQLRPVAGSSHLPAGWLTLQVETPDGLLDLRLQPATRLETNASPMVPAIRDGRTRIYQGTVAGQPSSWVRLSRIGDAWLGAIQVADKLWLLDPAREHRQLAGQLGLGDNDTLVFTLSDLQGMDFLLDHGGVAVPASAMEDVTAYPTDDTQNTGASESFLGVTLVLDTEFQAHYGSDASSTAVAILNIVDGLYMANASIHVYLHALEALTDNGLLTDTNADELLQDFQSWFFSSSLPFSGTAQLMSGKNFDDSTVGMAWLGQICSRRFGNGVNQMTFSAAGSAVILAHEMGHNFDLDHDGDGNTCASSGFIMNASINLGNPPTQFSSCSLQALDDYLTNNNLACLASPPVLIFENSFE